MTIDRSLFSKGPGAHAGNPEAWTRVGASEGRHLLVLFARDLVDLDICRVVARGVLNLIFDDCRIDAFGKGGHRSVDGLAEVIRQFGEEDGPHPILFYATKVADDADKVADRVPIKCIPRRVTSPTVQLPLRIANRMVHVPSDARFLPSFDDELEVSTVVYDLIAEEAGKRLYHNAKHRVLTSPAELDRFNRGLLPMPPPSDRRGIIILRPRVDPNHARPLLHDRWLASFDAETTQLLSVASSGGCLEKQVAAYGGGHFEAALREAMAMYG